MAYIFLGALGAVLALLLFGAGVYVGVKGNGRLFETAADKVHTETIAEEERRRLIEDQRAFQTLVNYSPDMAYGFVTAADVSGSKDGEF